MYLEHEMVLRVHQPTAPFTSQAVVKRTFLLVDDGAITTNDPPAVRGPTAVLRDGLQSTLTPAVDVRVRLAALEHRVEQAPLQVAPLGLGGGARVRLPTEPRANGRTADDQAVPAMLGSTAW